MGIPGYLMSSTINMIVAQRLVRKFVRIARKKLRLIPKLRRGGRALKYLNAEEAKITMPRFCKIRNFISVPDAILAAESVISDALEFMKL